MTLVLRHLQESLHKEKQFCIGKSKRTTYTDASRKMKISLMSLKDDSSNREASRAKHIGVLHPVSGASSDLMRFKQVPPLEKALY